MLTALVPISEEKESNFYSSDSDFDDDEPKKFHIQIRPVGSSSRSSSAANELELRATVGALTLPPNRGVSIKKHLSRNSSCTAGARSEGEGGGAPHRDSDQDRLQRSTSSPYHSRLSSTVSGSVALFGPPLESAFKTSRFADAAFSSDSSSPDNVEDSGLDSPSHQPLGPSPEPAGWAAWPPAPQAKGPAGLGRQSDPFLPAFCDPSPGRGPPAQDDPAGLWAPARCSPPPVPPVDPAVLGVPSFGRPLAPAELEPSVWSCRHIPQEDPFLAFERTAPSEQPPPPPEAWAPPPPCRSRDGRGREPHRDPISTSFNDCTALPPTSSSSRKDRDRDQGVPVLDSPEDPFSITMIGSPTHQSSLAAVAQCSGRSRLASGSGSNPGSGFQPKKEVMGQSSVHNPFSEGPAAGVQGGTGAGQDEPSKQRPSEGEQRRNGLALAQQPGPLEDLRVSADKEQNCLGLSAQHPLNAVTPPHSRRDSAELLEAPPARPARAKRTTSSLSGRSRSVCSSPLPGHSPPLPTTTSSSPCEWAGQTSTPRAPSPARGLSRGPSPISLSTQESWPVAAALTEYINAYFKGGEHNRCLVKITGDLTMSFPAGITRVFTANPNAPILSFRLVNIAKVDNFLPNPKLLYSDPSQSDPDARDFWFNMQALNAHLQREAELNPQASYYNVGILKYQVSSQDPACAPLLLSAECQRSGTVTRVSLDYRCCPSAAPAAQLTAVQVLLPLDRTATDPQCQPPASWNSEERRLLWRLPNLSPTSSGKGSGALCASWQCLEAPRGPPPSLAVQFVGSGASLSGMDVELVGGRYRMSLVKKRFATGKYMAGCSLSPAEEPARQDRVTRGAPCRRGTVTLPGLNPSPAEDDVHLPENGFNAPTLTYRTKLIQD
ncbi:hypothetical protein MATL_G00030460 [Megalops atlanticus]|uniref:MHD domain-containing protein n=1 Tax=Megalops atlanticus TaxID=7932 RepID=A0A9D3QCV1_MEGAT|nr:hypothetical protein MATL_G00030460 [Megalops atlanticus]